MAETTNEKAVMTPNPLSEEVLVEVAMPKSFKIKMVEASKLNDFKIWSAIFSLLTNVLVGFFCCSSYEYYIRKAIIVVVDYTCF